VLAMTILAGFLFGGWKEMPNEGPKREQMQKRTDRNKVIIVFEKLDNRIVKLLEEQYGLELLHCSTKRLCIFGMNDSLQYDTLAASLRRNEKIINVIKYRQYDFVPF
jgi:hypothetical protein